MADEPDKSDEAPAPKKADEVRTVKQRLASFLAPVAKDIREFWRGPDPGKETAVDTRKPLTDRHKALKAAGITIDPRIREGDLGIAFSGGGIRSATISLGVTQALVKKDRLLDFDYCSTVSGGGYFGSFLTSLFLPDWARGPTAQVEAPKGKEPSGEEARGMVTKDAEAPQDPLPEGKKSPAPLLTLLEKKEIAFDALGAKARSVNLKDPGRIENYGIIRNPIWWLREHSRYLAPNGTSDYLMAAVYMVRNWLAIIYVMTLPIALAAAIVIGIGKLLLHQLPSELAVLSESGASPIWLIVLLLAFFTLTSAAAFWSTESMSNTADATEDLVKGVAARAKDLLDNYGLRGLLLSYVTPRRAMVTSCVISGATAVLLLALIAPADGWLTLYSSKVTSQPPLHQVIAFGSALIMLSSLIGIIVALSVYGAFKGNAYVVEVRRRITALNAFFVQWAFVFAALALVDTAGSWSYRWLTELHDKNTGIRFFPALSASLVPIIALIINKAQEWFKEKDSFLRRFFGQSVWRIALAAGVLMFLILAISVDIFVQSLIFGPATCKIDGGLADCAYWDVLIVLGILTVLTGWSTGFINLSSLHGIYASRLTRAYLGASNLERLKRASTSPDKKPDEKDSKAKGAEGGKAKANDSVVQAQPVTPDKGDKSAAEDPEVKDTGEMSDGSAKLDISIKDSHPNDQIPIDVYQQTVHLGPLHLINVTLNETRSAEGSQLLERDRKGVPLVFAPEGIFVNAARERRGYQMASAYSWETLKSKGVEKLSVGQLCAISGAAASTAMGSQTTLGGALALSFANIRLGYWWNVKDLFRHVPSLTKEPGKWIYQKGTRPFRTFFYLWNELVADYTRQNARLNLSDGGHFDNSGAYELLRRKVKAIVVCDNGADPDFRFGDLEILIRKARIDLGFAIEVASSTKVKDLFGEDAATLFLNGSELDWRARAAARSDRSGASSPDDFAHSLLLEVFNNREDVPVSRILWMKPRLFTGLPEDVVGYALAQSDFPHEPTGDQFFNEAQWESYRALGYSMMETLLADDRGGSDALRKLIPGLSPSAATSKSEERLVPGDVEAGAAGRRRRGGGSTGKPRPLK